jgi:hypothetical protein
MALAEDSAGHLLIIRTKCSDKSKLKSILQQVRKESWIGFVDSIGLIQLDILGF